MSFFYYKFFIRFLFRSSNKEATAQIEHRIQPTNVICRIKHRIANSIFPLNKNEIEGKMTAINIISFKFSSITNTTHYLHRLGPIILPLLDVSLLLA